MPLVDEISLFSIIFNLANIPEDNNLNLKFLNSSSKLILNFWSKTSPRIIFFLKPKFLNSISFKLIIFVLSSLIFKLKLSNIILFSEVKYF